MATVSRIIAGSRGGRRLTTPAGSSTRPTSDRVREAVFAGVISWLGTVDHDSAESLAGQGFCDLYAGSGAVGLEAASRGADPVLLVEKDRRAAGVIRHNAHDLGLGAVVQAGKVEQFVATPAVTSYDIVWLDPPYDLATSQLDGVVADVVRHGWVREDGLVIVERSARTEPLRWPDAMADGWTKSYGETVVHFRHR